MPNGRIAGSTTPSSTRRAIGVGRNRRQQDAIAVMAGGIDQSLDRARAEDRCVVAAAGTMADPHFLDRQFLDRRHRPPGGIEQREKAAGGHRGVEAFLLDGGADDQPAIAARHQIDARRPQHMVDQRRRRVHAQRQHLSLDRTHRRTQFRRATRRCCATRRRRPARPRRRRPWAVVQHDAIGRGPATRFP